jgi:hypothetical protein
LSIKDVTARFADFDLPHMLEFFILYVLIGQQVKKAQSKDDDQETGRE